MCGIAGIIDFKGESNQVTAIKNMATSLQNRGPDDEGFLLFNNKVTSFYGDHSSKNLKNVNLPYTPKYHIDTAQNIKSKVAFGFKRLSIIDLSYAAHQPMSDTDQKNWIILMVKYIIIKKLEVN